MRLPLIGKKTKSKKDQTLDTVASIAKAWGEWQLAKGAAKAAKRTPWKLVAAIGAGIAAAGVAAKKLLGGGRDSSATTAAPPPAYTGPVPDPNAPTTPAGEGPATGSGEVGASPAAPVAPTDGPKLDPEAPATSEKPES
jgi:hypothetical protein